MTLPRHLTPLPPSSWDSHMHIVDPTTYPLSPTATYTPTPHLLPSYLSFSSKLSHPNQPPKPVLVQPSIYGTDNSCLLAALRTLGARGARGVVCFDPATTSTETLEGWDGLGVRGVRVNLVSVGRRVGGEELRGEVGGYVERVRGLGRGRAGGKGWVVQLYVDMSVLEGLVGLGDGDDDDDTGVRICIDHFGKPSLPPLSDTDTDTDTFDPYSLPGFSALVTMLRGGRTYVKFSAPYRISDDPEFRQLGVIARELIRVAPERVVFATDWPHTRFEGVDVGPFVRKCVEWCGGDEGMVERLFRRNAEELWDVDVDGE
ncbi:hypothetical protein FQN55_004273 [Onygenales sp. PD_40]|nr:hypothetical protein FQN55_004273 [Onygenales sp. PD_40]